MKVEVGLNKHWIARASRGGPDRTGGGWEGTTLGPFSTVPGARSNIVKLKYINTAASPVPAGTDCSATGTRWLWEV